MARKCGRGIAPAFTQSALDVKEVSNGCVHHSLVNCVVYNVFKCLHYGLEMSNNMFVYKHLSV